MSNLKLLCRKTYASKLSFTKHTWPLVIIETYQNGASILLGFCTWGIRILGTIVPVKWFTKLAKFLAGHSFHAKYGNFTRKILRLLSHYFFSYFFEIVKTSIIVCFKNMASLTKFSIIFGALETENDCAKFIKNFVRLAIFLKQTIIEVFTISKK